MTKLNEWKVYCAVLMLSTAAAIAAQAQTFSTLVNFDFKNGAEPALVTLIQGHNGNLFGTTEAGGNAELGTVFELSLGGELKTLYNFGNDGAQPQAGLVLGTDGNFYGTTSQGGDGNCEGTGAACGTVFKITASGALTTLHSFCADGQCYDGQGPNATLIQATDGHFYGTTTEGGATGSGGAGAVFRISAGGVLTTIHSFDFTDGWSPIAGVIQGSDGNLYGTTFVGGDLTCNQGEGCGTVFEIDRYGKFTTLHTFEWTDGDGLWAGLVQASDGNLYGTTAAGGTGCPGGCGTVFRITRTGSFTTIHNFDSTHGAAPYGTLIQATDGNLYGTTTGGGNLMCSSDFYSGCGVIFEITPDGTFSILHEFDGTDGAYPWGGLAQATNGILYGTTNGGGDAFGWGTLFSVDVGLGPFVTFVHDSGRVGRTGPILGQGFSGTTNVSLNGISVGFTVVSDTLIRATVPPGATTGFVTVTTPSGTLTSNVPFHVIK